MPNVMVALPNIGGVAPSVRCRKVWLMPTTRVPCSKADKTRNSLKFGGVPQTPKRSQPLVGRSSPYYQDMQTRYCCLKRFFRLSIHASVAKIQPRDGHFLRPVFAANRVQCISDMHLKFALRPHHVQKQCRHPAEIRRGKKERKIEKRKKPQDENIMACPIP